MKKLVAAIIIMVCWMSNADAQIKFGIKGGVNFDNFNYSVDDFTSENTTGWQAGALLQFKVPVIGLGVQPELLYSVKKADIDNETNSVSYFEVPLNIRWGFNLVLVRPFIMGGPYFSYAVNLDGDAFKDKVKRFDWGIGLGGGVEIWKFQLALRYAWGLQNISDVDDFELKNNTFSLSLGFLF